MTAAEAAKALELEERLKTAPPGQREPLFRELVKLYAEDLRPPAIIWASSLGVPPDPQTAGDRAFSRAFILIARKLDKLDFGKKSLLYQLKGKIFSELRHCKSRDYKFGKYHRQIEDDWEDPTDPRDRTEEQTQARDELKHLPRTTAEAQKLRAEQLQIEGFTWQEAAEGVGWKGSSESLRTSVSRLKRQIRERALRAESEQVRHARTVPIHTTPSDHDHRSPDTRPLEAAVHPGKQRRGGSK